MSLRVAIVTDDPGWHGRALRGAFAARGVESHFISLMASQIDMSDGALPILPGFERALPDAVFVRGVAGGSLQQVVFHLNVLHALTELGVPVYNDGRAIERSVDKSLTSLRLCRAGLPTPPTWVCSDREHALEIVRRETRNGVPLLCKPVFGSQGKGIQMLRSADDVPDVSMVDSVWYLQRFIGDLTTAASDWRVLVVGGQAVAAMRRTAKGWLTNVAQGGECLAAMPEGALRTLAEDAVRCLDMAYAGVDLMRDPQGRWTLIEVNSIPAWKGLQKVCKTDIAGCLADDLLGRCREEKLAGVAI